MIQAISMSCQNYLLSLSKKIDKNSLKGAKNFGLDDNMQEKDMKMFEYKLITTANAVDELCKKAFDEGIVSMDTEFMREKVYFAQLCLLQVAIGDEYFLVDTLAFSKPESIQPIAEVLESPHVIKIFHSCTQDVEVLSQHFNVEPKGMFDTQLAAGFCGHDGQIGYANLVAEICGVELDKSQTRTNWHQRPLSEKQLEYAVNDVVYLQALYEHFCTELKKRQRYEWFEHEIVSLIRSAIDNHDPELAYKRLNGANMSAKKQSLLVFLAKLRETVAQASDKPRPWVLKDADLYAVANILPQSHKELFSLDIRAGFLKRNADQILDFIESLEDQTPLVWPQSLPLTPEQKHQVKLLSQALNNVATETGVSRSIIGNRKDIEAFVGGRDAKFLHGWRVDLIGDSLSSLM